MADSTLPLPQALVEAAEEEGRTAWLATLPGTVARLAHAWSLTVEEPFQPGGRTAWVAPVRDGSGTPLVLKVGWAHFEAADEAEGLRAWAGRGAVRLHAAEQTPDTNALLLERCRPGTALTSRPEPEQDEVIAGLLRQLWVGPPAGTRFRPLTAMCQRWAEELEQQVAAEPGDLDPGLARDGIALLRILPTITDDRVLLTTDLHAGNVLAAEREPWLTVDPKPFVGDRAFDVCQHILNCVERLRAAPAGLAERMADLLDLDATQVRRWLFARCVQEATDHPPLAEVARRLSID